MSTKGRELGWIDTLLRIDTTSAKSNLGLIELVRDHLARLGLSPWLTYDRGGGKANLFCSVPDARGRTAGGIVLSGHTDVVPIDGQNWQSDPFVPTWRDDRLYARGAADMKTFLALIIEEVPALLSTRLRNPVHLALSFDEEVGCLGAPLMIAEMARRGIQPTGCIVGEPSNMQIVGAHKGVSAYRCRVHGRAAHSSLPQSGVNAIEHAARLIGFIGKIAEEMCQNGPFDNGFDVPHSSMLTASIRGGGVVNTIPDFCEFDFTIRNLPEVEVADIVAKVREFATQVLLPQMQRSPLATQARIEFEQIFQIPSFRAKEAAQLTQLVQMLSGAEGFHKVAYGTEAGLFQLAGVPAIVCGPGDIRVAHRPDEFIGITQIERCRQMLSGLTRSLTAV